VKIKESNGVFFSFQTGTERPFLCSWLLRISLLFPPKWKSLLFPLGIRIIPPEKEFRIISPEFGTNSPVLCPPNIPAIIVTMSRRSLRAICGNSGMDNSVSILTPFHWLFKYRLYSTSFATTVAALSGVAYIITPFFWSF
jgi:hypothetical protein